MNNKDIIDICIDVHKAAMEALDANMNSGKKFNEVKWQKYFSDQHGISFNAAKQIANKHMADMEKNNPEEKMAGEM